MITRNVIIIGSGPAGLTAALYTARANLQPLVIEGLEAGGQLMLTTLVENWPGHRDGIMGPDLMAEMRAQAEKFGAEIIQGHVTSGRSLQRRRSSSRPPRRSTRRSTLIIATGASARLLGLAVRARADGPRRLDVRDLRRLFLPRPRNRRRRRRRLGDGGGGVPDRFASKVTVVHRRDDAARVEDHAGQGAREPEDRVVLEQRGRGDPRRRQGRGDRRWSLRDNKTGVTTEMPVSGVFVAIGHTPNTSLFRGQIELDANGYIITHDGAKTSVPGVFACGDVQDHIYRQAITAAGSGCMAAHRRRALSRRHAGAPAD